jgi:hypothetical protein
MKTAAMILGLMAVTMSACGVAPIAGEGAQVAVPSEVTAPAPLTPDPPAPVIGPDSAPLCVYDNLTFQETPCPGRPGCIACTAKLGTGVGSFFGCRSPVTGDTCVDFCEYCP